MRGNESAAAAGATADSPPDGQRAVRVGEHDTGDSVLREYVINRHGRDYVLYAGLLAEAHRRGLRHLLTRLVQIPSPQNGFMAICHAEVTIAAGTFQATGDASPTSTGGASSAGSGTGRTGGSLVGMAETRAKARAMCDALGVNMIPIDDLLERQPLI